MAANIRNKNFVANFDFKIDDVDIEIKENNFINDKYNCYKTAKTKIKKYFGDDKNYKPVREK